MSYQSAHDNIMTTIPAVPTPRINVTLPSSTLYAGTNLSVVCGISINAAVDNDISVNVTWLNGSVLLSNRTERIFISTLSSTKPSFTSTLLIHPIVDVDNASNFTCRASIHSNRHFIERSNVGEGSIHISVKQRSQLITTLPCKYFYTFIVNLQPPQHQMF